ncbi:MAG: RsmB/NOP family class I SAM-dependent RNA methyltransferase [Bacteroidota bacterium]
MKKSSLIGHAVELLDLIRPLKQPADNIVKDFFRTRHYLGSKDRRFISDATFGILRNYRLLKVYADMGMKIVEMSHPQVPSLLIYISYAVKIQKEEIAAIVSDVQGMWQVSHPRIECEKGVNAILQSTLPTEVLENPTKRIAVTYSFPDSIVEEWIGRFGEVETEKLCEGSNQPAPIDVRVNILKATPEECRARLLFEGIESEPTKLSPFGLVLNRRINAQALQSFKDGLFEMQDEGSQLLSLLLEPKAGQIIVDACAGGGGKTVHIAALMKNEGELHSIDVDEKRLANIRPRIIRSGATIVQLHLAEKGKEFSDLIGRADAVLVDAPCSGIGTFRRNPAAKLSFTQEYVERIAKTQRSVLETYAEMVKSGGRLVYTTCTLLRKENEDVVESFLQSNSKFSLISASEILGRQNIPIESSSNYLTLLQHKNGTDGFFAAIFQKM